MSTVDRALALLTGDEPQHTQTPSARTIEKAVAWEIEDEIAAKTGRARFGPLQALAGDLDALEESIKEVDAWLAKNVDDLDGVDAAVRDVSDDTKTNEVVTENLESLDRVLAKVVATAPQGLSLHPRAEKALRLRMRIASESKTFATGFNPLASSVAPVETMSQIASAILSRGATSTEPFIITALASTFSRSNQASS